MVCDTSTVYISSEVLHKALSSLRTFAQFFVLSLWDCVCSVYSILNSETGHVSKLQNWGTILTLNHLLQDSQDLPACFYFWSCPDSLYYPGQLLRPMFVYSSSIHFNKVPKLGAWAPTSFSTLSVETP